MRVLLLALTLSALSAFAAVTGKVVGPKGPVAGAKVSGYLHEAPNALCPEAKSVQNGVYKCLCFGKTEALGKELAKGAAPKPLATATTAADGAFTLEGDPQKTWLVITSADGAAGVAQKAEGEVFTLAPMNPLRVKLNAEGLDGAKAKVFALDLGTGAVDVMARGADGLWTTGPRPGTRIVVALVPGAAPLQDRIGQNGKSTFHRGWQGNAPEFPELNAGTYQRVEGSVTRDGKPVAGATVVGEPQGCAYSVKSDAQGRFAFEHAPAAPQLLTARASHQGFIGQETLRAQQSNTIALVKAGVLEATFLGADQKPLAGYAVDAHWRRADNNQVGWEQLETDAKGSLRVEFPGAGSVQLRPRRWDLAFTQTRQAEVKVGETTRATFRLVPAAPLDVEVVDGAGQPVAGVRVQVYFGEDLQPKVSADLKESLREVGNLTDARGVARIRALMPGNYEVEVDDHRLGRANAFGSAPGKIQIRLGDTPILKVMVTDASGVPVEGTRINVKQANTSRGGTTDAQGVMQLALPPGGYEVSLGHKGEVKQVELKKGTTEVKFVTTAPAKVQGMVVDTSGKPIAGAVVHSSEGGIPPMPGAGVGRLMRMYEMQGMARYRNAPQVKSDEKGAFSANGGEGKKFWARAEGYGPTAFAEPKDGKVTVVLAPRPVAVGRVVDARGKPIAQAQVGMVLTGADGKFRLTLDDDLTGPVRVQASGRPPVTFELNPGASDREIALPDIRLEDGIALAGKVLDAVTAQALKHARITVRWPGSKEELVGLSQQDGTFKIEGAPQNKPLEAEVSLDKYQTVKLPVKVGPASLLLKLPPLGAMEVTLKNMGEPVAGATVYAEGPSRDPRSEKEKRQHSTDALGTVRMDDLAPGEWWLRFEREREPFAQPMKVTLKPGETKKVTASK